MSLKATLNEILELQAKHKEMLLHKKDREALYLDVKRLQERLNELRNQREEIRKRRIESQKAADALELKIREAEVEIGKLQVQLNVTKHQSDYDAIRHSIASHKADISKWEDEALGLLQHVDELHREMAALDKQSAEEEEKLRQLERSVSEQASAHDEKIAGLEREKEALAARIDLQVLAAYQRILSSRGDMALVPVKNRICQGCFTTITKEMMNDLQKDREVIYCPSCGRILMLSEEDSTL